MPLYVIIFLKTSDQEDSDFLKYNYNALILRYHQLVLSSDQFVLKYGIQ